MANEGSTKPTYSDDWNDIYEDYQDAVTRLHKTEAELERVRGLLQRTTEALKSALNVLGDVPHGADRFAEGISARVVASIVVCENALEAALTNPSGAESADIGKLDTADKKAVSYEILLSCMRAYVIGQKKCGNPATMKDLREYRSWKNMPQDTKFDQALLEEINGAGSAETGGEKAAGNGELAEGSHPLLDFNEFDYEDCAACAFVETDPCPYHIGFANGARWGVANFPRSSQNQTVASGVEGAHEGTTADKSGSREPEKLNNAQESALKKELCPKCNFEHILSFQCPHRNYIKSRSKQKAEVVTDHQAEIARLRRELEAIHSWAEIGMPGPYEPEPTNKILSNILELSMRTLAESSLSSPPTNSETTVQPKSAAVIEHAQSVTAADKSVEYSSQNIICECGHSHIHGRGECDYFCIPCPHCECQQFKPHTNSVAASPGLLPTQLPPGK